jgi:hypothetical protein
MFRRTRGALDYVPVLDPTLGREASGPGLGSHAVVVCDAIDHNFTAYEPRPGDFALMFCTRCGQIRRLEASLAVDNGVGMQPLDRLPPANPTLIGPKS